MSYLPILDKAVELCAPRSAAAAGKLADHVELLRRCPPDRRDAVAAAIRTLHPRLYVLPDTIPPGSTPYPHAPQRIQARLLLGETPAAISGGLTRAEAHQWLTEDPEVAPAEWLLAAHDAPITSARSVAVARWVLAVLRDPQRADALTREREERGPHGEVVAGSYLDRADELIASDLVPSVEQTFRRAGARMLREVQKLMARQDAPLAQPPRWWRPARCARLLLTPSQLAAEGKIMGHCVAQYAGYVRRGESVIVALDVPERLATGEVVRHRSTVELSWQGRVQQHKGPRNCKPHPLCDRALAVLCRRWWA